MNQTFVHAVRHAEAGDPARWPGPDLTRPLSPGGNRQAVRLAELFSDVPFTHLLSSPYLRCTETFDVLSAARGLAIETRDELAEGQPWEYLQKVVLESEGEGPTAISVHGEALRALMQDLFERGVARLDRGNFHKGSTWVLGVGDGAIASARHVTAPSAK
ncbi:MAG: phosphoglycerate mutase family protein [Actinomycetota bacterium]